MTKNTIIEQWFRDSVVQKIVKKITDGSNDSKYDDLVQMIYLSLLEKDESLIQSLYETGQYKYYISRMAMLQIASKNSRLYYQLRKFSAASSPYDTNHPYEDEECVERRENWQQLKKYIDTLQDLDKAYIEALLDCGTQKEVAKVMNVTEGAVNKRFKRIFKQLRYLKAKEEAEIKGQCIPKLKIRRYTKKLTDEEMTYMREIMKNPGPIE